MDRSVVQALSSLIPALTGPLPPDLIELARSLLAQSRSKASNLKADEEIARAYACANIACERCEAIAMVRSEYSYTDNTRRSKQKLALPKIESRPPCPPKVYQRLYKYLDGVLPGGTRKSARATNLDIPTSSPVSSPVKPRTPARGAHLRPDFLKTKTTPKRTTKVPEIPSWVMPAIRELCKKMSATNAPHHIFAGVSSIYLSEKTQQVIDLKLSALIVAVYCLVITRLAGVGIAQDEYERQKNLSLAILKESFREVFEGEDVQEIDVDECTKQFKDRQWTRMDWFGNIPVGVGVGSTNDASEVAADAISDDEEAEEGRILPMQKNAGMLDFGNEDFLQAGLGTMVSHN